MSDAGTRGWQAGDEALFGGKRFTLIELAFDSPHALWMAVETDNPNAELRGLVEQDLKPVPR